MMDQIYAKAQMTIIWLGRDDGYTRTAGAVFSHIHEFTPEQANLIRADFFIMKSGDTKNSGFSQIDDQDWLAVYAFFNRSCFRRVWIIQEVALAVRSVILCGKVMLSWSQLVRICLALEKSKTYEHIEVLAAKYMTSKQQENDNTRDRIDSQPSLYRTDTSFRFSPILTIIGSAHVRAGLGIEDIYLNYVPDLQVSGLTELMALFRSSQTSEPRDRVYGYLGLVPAKTIIPDYGKSIETVYLGAIHYHLETSNDLSFLGDVQDLSQQSIAKLPPWLPDYNSELIPQRFSKDPAAAPRFCVSEGFGFTYELLMEPAPVLRLQGYILGAIEDVADFDIEHDLLDLLELLWDLPHLYKADVHHRADEITDGYEGTFDLKVEGGYLRGVQILEESTTSEGSQDERTTKLLPEPEFSKSWLANARLQKHVEVLWRTLIADTWEGQHPAPIEAGFAFVDVLISKMQHLCLKIHALAAKSASKTSESDEPNEGEVRSEHEASLQQLYDAFNVFASSEYEGFTRVEDIKLIAEDGTANALSSADPLVASLPREKVSQTLTQFFPIFERFSDMVAHPINMDNITLWYRRSGQFMPGRKLFRTSPYPFLGSGPKSLKVGDSVCVLAGGNVPYLLRKVEGETENQYNFIGEAYVHGMMHGEAKYIMAEENESLGEILLV